MHLLNDVNYSMLKHRSFLLHRSSLHIFTICRGQSIYRLFYRVPHVPYVFLSYNRAKIRKKLSKKQRKLANARKDSLHKASNEIVESGNIIVFEDLNIQGMVQNHNLAKSISDSSWSKLIDMCIYKAENAGKYIEFVNPRGTSQLCSRCGAVVKKDLSVRIHSCNNCGLVMDRDLNAALNIRGRYIRHV